MIVRIFIIESRDNIRLVVILKDVGSVVYVSLVKKEKTKSVIVIIGRDLKWCADSINKLRNI